MDKTLKEIIEKVKENGGNMYQVGGSVRDEILGIPNNDEDYCVTGLEENEFENIFPNALKLGKSFKVYNISGKEIALARTERKTKLGHKGFEVFTNKNITIEQDLKRRDITINSIAKDLYTNKYIDPFDGIKDIKNRIIRATSNAFCEDPLRVYRVARFSASLDFSVDDMTIKMMETLKDEMLYISKERIFKEFDKAMKSKNPQKFFEILYKANVLDVHFEEIYNICKYNYNGENAFTYIMKKLKNSVDLTDDEKIRFTVLIVCISNIVKNNTLLKVKVNNLAKRIGLPKKWSSFVNSAIINTDKYINYNNLDILQKVDFFESVYRSDIGFDGLKIICLANNCYNIEYNNINFEKIAKEMLRKIDGKYIIDKYNIKPDKLFKETLRQERAKWLKNNIHGGKRNV